jgi:hypothetical protein
MEDNKKDITIIGAIVLIISGIGYWIYSKSNSQVQTTTLTTTTPVPSTPITTSIAPASTGIDTFFNPPVVPFDLHFLIFMV